MAIIDSVSITEFTFPVENIGLETAAAGVGEVSGRVTVERPGPASRMNDGKCDPRGRFFAGTLQTGEGPGALWRLDPDGSTTRVVDDVQIAQAVVRDLDAIHELRDDADDVAAGLDRAVGERAHRADRGAAVHDRERLACEDLPQTPGGVAVHSVGLAARRAIDADSLHGPTG